MTEPIRAALERLHQYSYIFPMHDTDEIVAAARTALDNSDESAVPLKERPDFMAGYREGLADGRRIVEHEDADRAALAESDRPAVPEGYIDPEHQEGDRALLEAFYEACLAEGGTADEITLPGLHAVLARWGRPATPAAGEVGELVSWLGVVSEQFRLAELDDEATQTDRAATLLEQLSAAQAQAPQAAPVPVAADVYFEFAVSDADYCTQAGGIAPTYAQALDEGQRYLTQYQQDGVHTLELRRVEVLPIPQEES